LRDRKEVAVNLTP